MIGLKDHYQIISKDGDILLKSDYDRIESSPFLGK